MDFELNNPRLNRDLGDNALRVYLAAKRESGQAKWSKPPNLRPYRGAFSHTPRILLLSPGITIPVNMPKRCIPPLGLSYVAAALEQHGHSVLMYDCCVEGYENEQVKDNLLTYGIPAEDLPQRLKTFEPDLIGISVLFSTDLPTVLRICCVCKRLFPDTPILLGGLHPTIYPQEVFSLGVRLNNGSPCFDWIIRGEGEIRLVRFVELFQEGLVDQNADGLAGILDGEQFFNPQVETIQNLDSIPFPAYHLLPMEKYFAINVPFSPAPRGDRVCQILTSRGCPVGCTFCASTNMYKEYRFRSVQNVLGEIEFLKEKYHVDEIQFADDNLTLNRDHTVEFMTALKGVKLPWCTPNGTMVNTLSPELLELMVAAGLYQITISLDSGSARTLKYLHHKPVNLQLIPSLIAKCQELGVWTHGTLVIGMPGETIADLDEGLEFVLEKLSFNSISTFLANPIPGSELYHQALDRGLITMEEASMIDTTKAKMNASGSDAAVLERIAFDFQKEFTERAMARDPECYERRYSRIRDMSKFTEVQGGRLA